jgi:5-oxoprolinase (ATP-hydrolysing) subunit C
MKGLRIIASGPGNTIQDAGRSGFLRFGLTPAGPMDWLRFKEANALAGNPEGSAVIEIGLGGLTISIEGAARRIGLAADGFLVACNGKAAPTTASMLLAPDQPLTIRAGVHASFATLAIGGCLALDPVLGSLASHLRSGIGPLQGQALATGMTLPLGDVGTDVGAAFQLPEFSVDTTPVRFIPGPQDDYFTAASVEALTNKSFQLTAQSDRMGYRFEGPKLQHSKGADIVSDGIVFGAMQVPGDGQLIILMADRQPTGGYPKIGTVIRADLPRLAQMRAGNNLRFQAVTVAEAVAALRQRIDQSDQRLLQRQWIRSGPDLDALMSGNFASGVQSALESDKQSIPQEF